MVDKTTNRINVIFNNIAEKYDLMNSVISFGLHKYIKKNFISNIPIKENSIVLDLCTGTGDLVKILSKHKNVKKVLGLDFSTKMLDIAKQRCDCHNVEFIEGDCTKLKFSDNTFDGITMGFGLRNIEYYVNTIQEIHRVLKSGGVFAHMDIYKSFWLVNIFFDLYIKFIVNFFRVSKESYDYLIQSKNEFITSSELSKIIELNGFKKIKSISYAFLLIKVDIFIKI